MLWPIIATASIIAICSTAIYCTTKITDAFSPLETIDSLDPRDFGFLLHDPDVITQTPVGFDWQGGA